MNCIRFDPKTFAVTGYGTISPESFEAAVDEGQSIISVDKFPANFALHLYDVDPETKTPVLSANPRPDPAAPPPPPDPRSLIQPISDRQFYQQAALQGFISREDAIAAVQSGFIPAPFQQFIDNMTDPDDKYNATMLFAGATTYYRQHHYTEMFGIAFGLTPEQVDTFWTEASRL